MRPLRLELKGFTAFRDPVEIDFAALDVFAISGSTGSGKSSLLDAMTYALFGRVERVGDRVGQLISQGQPRMAVTLEFEVGRERYRVTRSTRARGATKILLERQDPGGEWRQAGEGADRVQKAEPMIARIVGLTYDGFTRSVLLPQGKFAEFLVGDPRKRRDILTELLGLSLFRLMAERSGEISRLAKASAEASTRLLATGYAEVDEAAVRAARKAAQEALARCEAMAEIEHGVEGAAARWREAGSRVDLLEGLTKEAADLRRDAQEVATSLEAATKRASAAQAEARTARRASEAAARTEREQATRLAEAQGRLGTLESLAGAEAKLSELARIQERLEELDQARDGAQELLAARKDAFAAGEKALREAESELGRLTEEKREAEREHEAARHADLVGTVVAGRAVGDPCPVCGKALEQLPPGGGKRLARAARALEIAGRMQKRSEDAFAKAERVTFGAERDLADAEREIERTRAELDRCRAEREVLLPAIAEVFGGEVPLDPLGELSRRCEELQGRREDAAEAERAAREAERTAAGAALRAEQAAGEGTALVARLRALPVSRLLERARATLSSLEPAAALVGAVPAEPGEALSVARAWVEGASAIADTLAGGTHAARAAQERELEEARALLPPDIPAAAVTDVDTLQDAVRRAARDLDRTATASQKDAERLGERLEERRSLEVDIEAQSREAARFGALALELRADRLIAYLQAEALQLLAVAASGRLAGLSDGRYRIVYREDEFLVVDTWNGDEERSVRTLSGGETFLASLSLALALAEQVRSLSVTDRARLDSLFLDEGFGTLDQETLRVVVDAIEQLAGDGRLVGVITHVRELAEQFPRVEVEKSPRGSRVNMIAV